MVSYLSQCKTLGPGILPGLFFMLSVWAIWPTPLHFLTALPTGDSPVATVPMLNAWIIWWNAESISHGLSVYWDAPIFSPAPGSLALSEPQPFSCVVAPIVYATGSPIAAYNTYVLLTLILNGLFAWRLLLTLGCPRYTAMFGSMAVLLHPLALQNMEALQLLALWPILWTWNTWLNFRRQPTTRRGLTLGLCLALTAATSIHHAVFSLIVLIPSALFSSPFAFDQKTTRGLAVAFAVALALLLPCIWPMYSLLRENTLPRPLHIVQSLSAEPVDWLTTQPTTVLPLQHFETADFPLLPGLLRSSFALAAIWTVTSRHRFAFRFLVWVLMTSWLLSFGANIELLGWNAWDWFASRVPGMSGIRSPYRFAYFTQLAALLLASMTVGQWCRQLRRTYRKTSSSWARVAASIAALWLLVVLAFEVWPSRSYVSFPPHPGHKEAWIEFLKGRNPDQESLLCLPVARDSTERANEIETLWMMYSTIHKLPILNGYSGFSPTAWSNLQKALRSSPFSAETLEQARRQGATLLAIRRRDFASQQYLNSEGSPPPGTTLVFLDDRYAILSIDN